MVAPVRLDAVTLPSTSPGAAPRGRGGTASRSGRAARLAAAVAGSLALGALAACPTIDLGEDPSNPGVCRPSPQYFRETIWPEFLAPADTAKSCVGASGCHRAADGRSALRLDVSMTPDLDRNYQVTIRFLNCGTPSASPLYTKPVGGEDSHGGGDIFLDTDPQAVAFQGWF